MTRRLEYHIRMRPVISFSVAFLAALAFSALLVVPAPAQINAPPASVTSPGFGGRPINGTRPSVTSLGPQGFAPTPRPPLTSAGNGFHQRDGHRHRRQDSFVGPVWYAVPYAIDNPAYYDNPAYEDQPDQNDNEADYQGGPTIFDRRGSGERSYVPPVKDPPPPHVAQPSQPEESPAADPEPAMPPTLLVFKDGRTLELSNYAIVGLTLFDLTPGHRRKILIADLDLDATRKQNDERGITFQLPQSTQAN